MDAGGAAPPPLAALGAAAAAVLVLSLLPLAFTARGFLPATTLAPTGLLAGVPPWAQPERVAAIEAEAPANPLLLDPLSQFLPWREAARHDLLFNPAQGSGAALLANGQSAVLYPTEVLARRLPAFRAATFSQAARLLVAAWGMFLLARALLAGAAGSGQRRAAAGAGGGHRLARLRLPAGVAAPSAHPGGGHRALGAARPGAAAARAGAAAGGGPGGRRRGGGGRRPSGDAAARAALRDGAGGGGGVGRRGGRAAAAPRGAGARLGCRGGGDGAAAGGAAAAALRRQPAGVERVAAAAGRRDGGGGAASPRRWSDCGRRWPSSPSAIRATAPGMARRTWPSSPVARWVRRRCCSPSPPWRTRSAAAGASPSRSSPSAFSASPSRSTCPGCRGRSAPCRCCASRCSSACRCGGRSPCRCWSPSGWTPGSASLRHGPPERRSRRARRAPERRRAGPVP